MATLRFSMPLLTFSKIKCCLACMVAANTLTAHNEHLLRKNVKGFAKQNCPAIITASCPVPYFIVIPFITVKLLTSY